MLTRSFSIAVLIMMLSACAPTVAPSEKNSPKQSVKTPSEKARPSESALSAESVLSAENATFPDAPWFKREGDVKKIWEYVPPDTTGTTASPRGDVEFRITRVEADSRSLFLYAQRRHRNRGSVDGTNSGRSEAPIISMNVNACRKRPPRIAGVVDEDASSANLLAIPLSDLPTGDVQLEISAFGAKKTVTLMNYEDGLRVMTASSESRWYREVDIGDGTRGGILTYPELERCEAEISE